MQPEPNAKQLVVERIKSTTNILVTVSRDPSVDELSAALGLTLMLNKMDKHATAVFSGAVPPAIEFLEPGKTFENTTDSLRDFIIALDKEKADRLRYKVEEDVVRIFITPYRTTITDKDLNFSQGDFNVELIIALGVEKREDIDAAVTAHGRILHDATVVTINTKAEKSSVGSIDWNDPSASSLCEMLMSLSEALQSGLLDQQMSTALLTGIVSATDRFRNEHTSPKVMTMAAQLMAAGANQQLIATKLEETHELTDIQAATAPDGSTNLKEGESEKVSKDEPTPVETAPEPKADGEMTIAHGAPEKVETLPSVSTDDAMKDAEEELAAKLETVAPQPADDLRADLMSAGEAVAETPDSPIDDVKGGSSWRDQPAATPTFGGTLSATADEAEEEKRREEMSDQNHTLLSHDTPASTPPPHYDQPASDTDVFQEPEAPTVDDTLANAARTEPALGYEPLPEPHEEALAPEPTEPTPAERPATLSELEAQARASATDNLDDARAEVDAALSSIPFNPAGQPMQGVGAQPFGDTIRPEEPAPVTPVQPEPVLMSEPEPTTEPLPVASQPVSPVSSLPPLPDFSTLPPLPGEEQQPPHPAMTDPSLSQDPIVTVPTDPAEFKIPGQP